MNLAVSAADAAQAEKYNRLAARYLRDSTNPRLCVLAIPFYQKSLALDPGNTQTYMEMGAAYHWLGDAAAAVACCEQALALDPGLLEAHVRRCVWQVPLIHEYSETVEQSRRNYSACLSELEGLLAATDTQTLAEMSHGAVTAVLPGMLAYQGYDVRELQVRFTRLVSQVMAARYPQWTAAPRLPMPQPGERLRVGFVSTYFSESPHWRMALKGWLTRLDPARFAVFGYSVVGLGDATTEYARAQCVNFVDGWHKIGEWCRLILQDKLHALIFMEAPTDRIEIRLAALKLAPLRCAAWTSPVTTGLSSIDYFLSGDLVEPPDAAAHYSEELIRLPNLSNYIEPRQFEVAEGRRADFGLRDEAIVYLCDQWLVKYLPQYDTIFPQIARIVGDCQFVFHDRFTTEPVRRQFEQRLERAFAEYGLDWEHYVVMRPMYSEPLYHRLCELSDVFLDSLDYSGATTTVEAALAHDIPVVSYAARFMRGRQTLGILRRMGLLEAVAANVAEYLALAARLGTDGDYRRLMSARVAENKHKVYRDMEPIVALEDFLERTIHKTLAAQPQ